MIQNIQPEKNKELHQITDRGKISASVSQTGIHRLNSLSSLTSLLRFTWYTPIYDTQNQNFMKYQQSVDVKIIIPPEVEERLQCLQVLTGQRPASTLQSLHPQSGCSSYVWTSEMFGCGSLWWDARGCNRVTLMMSHWLSCFCCLV